MHLSPAVFYPIHIIRWRWAPFTGIIAPQIFRFTAGLGIVVHIGSFQDHLAYLFAKRHRAVIGFFIQVILETGIYLILVLFQRIYREGYFMGYRKEGFGSCQSIVVLLPFFRFGRCSEAFELRRDRV